MLLKLSYLSLKKHLSLKKQHLVRIKDLEPSTLSTETFFIKFLISNWFRFFCNHFVPSKFYKMCPLKIFWIYVSFFSLLVGISDFKKLFFQLFVFFSVLFSCRISFRPYWHFSLFLLLFSLFSRFLFIVFCLLFLISGSFSFLIGFPIFLFSHLHPCVSISWVSSMLKKACWNSRVLTEFT